MADKKTELDQEWIELIKEAKAVGLTVEEIKQFLESGSILLIN